MRQNAPLADFVSPKNLCFERGKEKERAKLPGGKKSLIKKCSKKRYFRRIY